MNLDDDNERKRRKATDILADGQSLTVPLQLMDSLSRAVVVNATIGVLHKPGQVGASDTAARAALYRQRDAATCDAWRTPPEPAPLVNTATIDAPRNDREAAYKARDAWLEQAWRS